MTVTITATYRKIFDTIEQHKRDFKDAYKTMEVYRKCQIAMKFPRVTLTTTGETRMFDETQEQPMPVQQPLKSYTELSEQALKRMVSLKASGMQPDKICAMFAIDPEDYPKTMKRMRANRVVTK